MQLSNVYASERVTRAVCCSRRLRHAVDRPVWPRSALQQQQGHRRWCRSAAAAGAQSTSDIEAQQQQQQQKAPGKSKKEGMTMRAKRSTDPKKYYDLSFFHYMPAWLQPAPILGAGAVFFLLALALDQGEPFEKTAVLAAGPVLLFWGMLLFLMPRLFRSFAVEYMRSHPEDPSAASKQRSSSSSSSTSDS